MNELRRHIYGNTADRSTVKKFIQLMFPKCNCTELNIQHNNNDGCYSNHGDDGYRQALSDSDIEMFFSNELDDDINNEIFSKKHEENNEKDSSEIDRCSEVSGNICEENSFVCVKQSDTDDGKPVPRVHDKHREIDGREPGMSNPEKEFVTDETNVFIDNMDDINRETNDCDNVTNNEMSETNDTNTSNINKRNNYDNYENEENINSDKGYCSGHRVGVCIDTAVQTLDMPEENIFTLMSYLELHPRKWLQVLNPLRSACTVKCYGGPEQFQLLAKKFPPIALAVKRLKKDELKSLRDMRQIDFDFIEIADSMCWDVITVAREVRSLQWNMTFALDAPLNTSGKSGIIVECESLSFHCVTSENINDDDKDEICDFLCKNISRQEESRLLQLNALYNVLRDLSCQHFWQLKTGKRVDVKAREDISRYFLSDEVGQISILKEMCTSDTSLSTPARKWNAMASDIRNLLVSHPNQDFSGRAVARIFQGIDSPCYPAYTYGRDRRFWRQYLDVDFNEIRKFAVHEIIRFRS